jgi:5-methylcytosine-specific restriction endonuclease McrA
VIQTVCNGPCRRVVPKTHTDRRGRCPDCSRAEAKRRNNEPIRRARLSIPQSLRRRIFARDGHRCVLCGATEDLTLGHITPLVLGGALLDESNLRTECRSCNSSAGAKLAHR